MASGDFKNGFAAGLAAAALHLRATATDFDRMAGKVEAGAKELGYAPFMSARARAKQMREEAELLRVQANEVLQLGE